MGQEWLGPSYFLITLVLGPLNSHKKVRTFLKVYMELGSYFLFLQEQTKDSIIIEDFAGGVLVVEEGGGGAAYRLLFVVGVLQVVLLRRALCLFRPRLRLARRSLSLARRFCRAAPSSRPALISRSRRKMLSR